jgi:hypothetical protein
VLTKQNIYIESKQDRVVLKVQRLEIEMPYATSFKVAQGLRLASRAAIRYAKADYTAPSDIEKAYEASADIRVTAHKDFNWRAGWEGEDVKIQFGDQLLKFHFTAALKIAEWLRDAGKQSKAWAGDTSRSISAAGILSDAEQNYRLGVE